MSIKPLLRQPHAIPIAESKFMTLIQIVFVLVIVGAILWAINNLLSIDGKILKIINFVVVLVVVCWLVQEFGLLSGNFKVPKLK